MKHIAERFWLIFTMLALLAVSLGEIASAQGSSSNLYFPFVLSAKIAYPNTTRVSFGVGEVQAEGWSKEPSISGDGRFVAFTSFAENLVNGDTNDTPDIFVYDHLTGMLERVSLSSGGDEANGHSGDPSISSEGRFVAFYSSASSLVDGDTNGAADVFVHDRLAGETRRISVSSYGAQADEQSWRPSISGTGRYVAFESSASNLVAGDTNVCDYSYNDNCADIFVHDLLTGKTSRVSVASAGTQADGGSFSPDISADGRFVVFESEASNLAILDTNEHYGLFVHDRETGETTHIRGGSNACISADGRFVAYDTDIPSLVSGDTNGLRDVFVYDRMLELTERVSLATGGEQGNAESIDPSISADGRYIAFSSGASNLVSDDTNQAGDIFLRDRQTGATELISISYTSTTGNSGSQFPLISQDGRYVAFESWASNLVSGDTQYCTYMNCPDVFLFDRGELDGP